MNNVRFYSFLLYSLTINHRLGSEVISQQNAIDNLKFLKGAKENRLKLIRRKEEENRRKKAIIIPSIRDIEMEIIIQEQKLSNIKIRIMNNINSNNPTTNPSTSM